MRRGAFYLALLLASCERPPDPEIPVITTKDGIEMLLLPGGEFEMGSGEGDEAPVHKVRLDPFLIDRNEVTQEQFDRLEFSNPSHFKGAKHPVDNVTWVLAVQFCNLRSEAEGLEPCYDPETAKCDFTKNGYRLPTEAEWEYACRAGAKRNPSRWREVAWFDGNSKKSTHPVGQKKANRWGLNDMHGNVAEWCNEPYSESYYSKSPADNPRGPEEGDMYVVRGGAWNSSEGALRWSARGCDRPGFGDACLAPDMLGFRCVRKAPDPR